MNLELDSVRSNQKKSVDFPPQESSVEFLDSRLLMNDVADERNPSRKISLTPKQHQKAQSAKRNNEEYQQYVQP